MRLVAIIALLGLTSGCASSRDHQDGSGAEAHFSTHEGRPEGGHHSSGSGSSGPTSGNSGGDGILDSILGVLFGGDDC